MDAAHIVGAIGWVVYVIWAILMLSICFNRDRMREKLKRINTDYRRTNKLGEFKDEHR